MWKLIQRIRHLKGLPPRLVVLRLTRPLFGLAQVMLLCLLNRVLPINSTYTAPVVRPGLRTLLLDLLVGVLVPGLMHFMPRYQLVLLFA